LVDGFTIRNCNGASLPVSGAGVYIYGGTVQNCLITGNNGDHTGNAWGGGAFLYPLSYLKRCIVSSNSCYLGPGVVAMWVAWSKTVLSATTVKQATITVAQ